MKRIRDYGVIIGEGKTGRLNKITDVPGVKVGHYTVSSDNHKTGITAIMPSDDNIYLNKMVAASSVINGYGKTMGLTQINELGSIETPIFLTNTLNSGKIYDGVVSYMIDTCKKDGVNVTSCNPIVGECNDYPLNDISERILEGDDVRKAILDAKVDFEEGSIGAGAGMSCLGMKGGVGSASRLTLIDGKFYTIGILVVSNFGGSRDMIFNGKYIGDVIDSKVTNLPSSKGSIMMILATDLPVNERQLKRMLNRTSVGLARVGSYIGHDSGDVAIGFTTANRLGDKTCGHFRTCQVVLEEKLSYVFKMVAEMTEEAVLNSLATAFTTTGFNGKTKYSFTDVYLNNYFKGKNYKAYIDGVKSICQFPSYPVGCELVTLYMLLKYYGVSVTIDDIVSKLKKGPKPYLEDGVLYGADPEIEFVGDPRDVYSYGVYEGPIIDVANYFKPGIINVSGSSLDEVLKLVSLGYPVMVWTSIRLKEPFISKSWICKENGKKIDWKANLHVVIVIGYSDNVVTVCDCDTYSITDYDRNKFEEVYNYFGKRVLYYKEKL